MTREEAIAIIRKEYLCVDRDCDIERSCGRCDLNMPSKEPILKAYEMAIKALSQEPCEKCEVGNPCLYCKHDFEETAEQEPCDDAEDLGDYPDTIHNQFDNMTGSMNL